MLEVAVIVLAVFSVLLAAACGWLILSQRHLAALQAERDAVNAERIVERAEDAAMHLLKLPLRAFTLPISLPTLVLTQAWHPRYDKDPAHRWLRETIKSSCDATWLAAQPD